jgi:hypothetical protein
MAIFVVTPIDAETITLQVKERSIDGRALSDIKELKLKRVK